MLRKIWSSKNFGPAREPKYHSSGPSFPPPPQILVQAWNNETISSLDNLKALSRLDTLPSVKIRMPFFSAWACKSTPRVHTSRHVISGTRPSPSLLLHGCEIKAGVGRTGNEAMLISFGTLPYFRKG